MNILFENKSKDLGAQIIFKDNSVSLIPPGTTRSYELSDDNVIFSVKYLRDFTFGYEAVQMYNGKITEQITGKLAEKALDSICNTIVQVVNTYNVSDLTEDAVIEVADKAYYLSVNGFEAFIGYYPALYYFGQAECRTGKVQVISSNPINRPEFLSLYKFIFQTTNMHGILFNVIKYKLQIDRHRDISSPKYLTFKFNKLYDMTITERENQFKPLKVLTDEFFKFVRRTMPKRVYNRLVKRFKKYFNIR